VLRRLIEPKAARWKKADQHADRPFFMALSARGGMAF
jgi:hypothetical protein